MYTRSARSAVARRSPEDASRGQPRPVERAPARHQRRARVRPASPVGSASKRAAMALPARRIRRSRPDPGPIRPNSPVRRPRRRPPHRPQRPATGALRLLASAIRASVEAAASLRDGHQQRLRAAWRSLERSPRLGARPAQVRPRRGSAQAARAAGRHQRGRRTAWRCSSAWTLAAVSASAWARQTLRQPQPHSTAQRDADPKRRISVRCSVISPCSPVAARAPAGGVRAC